MVKVNGDRLWASLARSSKLGAGSNGGLNRLALTDADKEMRDQFRDFALAGGFGVTVDGFGNMIIGREGAAPELVPVLIGSHLDS